MYSLGGKKKKKDEDEGGRARRSPREKERDFYVGPFRAPSALHDVFSTDQTRGEHTDSISDRPGAKYATNGGEVRTATHQHLCFYSRRLYGK